MEVQKLLCAAVMVAFPGFFTGCRQSSQIAKPTRSTQQNQLASAPKGTPEPDQSVSEFIKQLPFVEKERKPSMLRAWARTPSHDSYRVARSSDLEAPSKTSDYGELAGAYGLALMIVDKAISEPKRFGLVIFVDRPGAGSDMYWIYRQMDLSKYKMSRASGDIFVNQVHEDGSKSVCEIRWDKKERTWACRRV